MKLIPLTHGKFTKVDDEDYDFLMQWKWNAVKNSSGKYYACRNEYLGGGRANGKFKSIRIHRLLLNAPIDSLVDHKDGDSLNNQRENIRVCSIYQNACNRTSEKNSTSTFFGSSQKIR